jgi:hypothetical protein
MLICYLQNAIFIPFPSYTTDHVLPIRTKEILQIHATFPQEW